MRLLTGAVAVSITLSFAARADAIGRTPGNLRQVLGWGSGAGYHAPIAYAPAPWRRTILHPPGGDRWGGDFGHSRLQPGFAAPFAHHGPPAGPVYFPPESAEAAQWGVEEVMPPPSSLVPPESEAPGQAVRPAPPAAGEETVPVPDAAAPRRYHR